MLDKLNPDLLPRPTLDRRGFLKVVGLSGAGFMVGCGPADVETPAAGETAAEADLNHFVRIGTDNTVTVIVKHLDKGQGVTTGLPTIVAEELDADWSQMRHEFAPADATRYNHVFFGPFQITVRAAAMRAAKRSAVRGPMSSPIRPAGMAAVRASTE